MWRRKSREEAPESTAAASGGAGAARAALKHQHTQAALIREQVASMRGSTSSRVRGGGTGKPPAPPLSPRTAAVAAAAATADDDLGNSVLSVSYRQLEAENSALKQQVDEQHRRLVVVEEKLEQVLGVLNSEAFRSTLAKEEEAAAAKEGEKEGAASTSVLANKLRGFVSLKKYRFQKDGFDLDLSYITPQIIAMGFPTEGVEAVYRNPMGEVQRFFETYHKGAYKIYNLCCEADRQYDVAKFHGRVASYPFQDHNACALSMMRPCCEDIHEWLSADPSHVAAIHCKAGKGRTGTMICAYLAHAGIAPDANAEESLRMFGTARTMNGKGVTIPSQQRFVRYYADLVRSGFSMPTYMYTINRIRLSPVPLYHYAALGGGCTPYFHVYWVDSEQHKIFDSTEHIRNKRYKANDGALEFNNLNALDLSVGGTFKVQFFHDSGGSKGQKMCHFWLHTAFLPESGRLTLRKHEVDGANKDSTHFASAFRVDLFFEKEDEAPLTDPEYLLDAQGSAYQMKKVEELMHSMRPDASAGGGRSKYNHHRHRTLYIEEEWDDDEQEMLDEEAETERAASVDRTHLATAPSAAQLLQRDAAESGGGAAVDERLSSPDGAADIGTLSGAAGSSGDEKVVVVKEGWLNKKGVNRRNWKKRWFMLQIVGEGADQLTVLAYYESNGAQEPKGVIPLDGTVTRTVTITAMQQRHPYCFEVAHPDRRTFYLEPHSGSQSEAAEWINAINQVCMPGGSVTHETMTSI